MKYLFILFVAVTLFFSGVHGGCTKWKEQINDSSYVQRPPRLTDSDIELLKDYANLLRSESRHAFEKAGGEVELIHRSRMGRIDLDTVEYILGAKPFDSELFDAFNRDFFKSYGGESFEEEHDDTCAVDLRILYPGTYRYIVKIMIV
tara:strand:+ start:165 stop:605 length:441 start_codon:yes stop_codon:yes gene_type:complete